jgi:D-arginine dehydrogenase
MCPVVRAGLFTLAATEDGAQDLDVAALLEHYRRRAVTNGVAIHTGVSIVDGVRVGGRWRLATSTGPVTATTLVNAAGAWADDVAGRCGLPLVGLMPLRRTIAVVSAPGADRSWPLVGDISEHDGFYFRPEGDGLLISPADQTLSEPVDARPETEDVALALERVNTATSLGLRHVRASWAGLRTFAPDHNPVVGLAAGTEGFCWLAGQGGYGMQTAPALAVLAAALVLGTTPPSAVDPQALAPDRFPMPAPARP